MTLNPLYTFDQLPTTSAAAIREFSENFLMALGASKPTGWADMLGELIPTEAPMVTFPISQLRTKYFRSQAGDGEARFKKLREKSFDIKAEPFQDGYQAALMDLFQKVFAYRRWSEAPARFVLAEESLRHRSIAALLEAGTSTACVDGANFFSTAHPCNMTDTSVGSNWSNYQSSTKDVISITNIAAEITLMKSAVKDENGDKMGVDPDTIIVPTEKGEGLRNLLAKELILDGGTSTSVTSAATTNPYKGRLKVIEAKELTDADDWYLVDSKLIAQGVAPWVSLRQTVPASLALRVFDESSDFFKSTGDIKMSSHVWYGFGLALPHAIRLIKGA